MMGSSIKPMSSGLKMSGRLGRGGGGGYRAKTSVGGNSLLNNALRDYDE